MFKNSRESLFERHVVKILKFSSYVQACVKEALRMFGPVPMGLPRIAPRGGLTFGDRTIPEGTIVSVSPWVIHHSKEYWGEDAHEFNPDRWLKGDAVVKEKF